MFDPHVLTDDDKDSYWGATGKYEADYTRLYEKLVPPYGPCETLEGELLRFVSKVYYRHNNDGDTYSAKSFAFLIHHIGDSFASYDEMIDRTLEYVLAQEPAWRPNRFDSISAAQIDEPEEAFWKKEWEEEWGEDSEK